MRPERQEQNASDQVHRPLVDVGGGVPAPEHGGARADGVADDAPGRHAWLLLGWLLLLGFSKKGGAGVSPGVKRASEMEARKAEKKRGRKRKEEEEEEEEEEVTQKRGKKRPNKPNI